MSEPGWDTEDRMARHAKARRVEMAPSVETERVPLVDVFERRVSFPHGGVYLLRDGETVVYVGIIDMPLRCRLMAQIYSRKTWAARAVEYTGFTVSMIRADYGERRRREADLLEQHAPKFNITGRPPGRPWDRPGRV